jgi:ubiquinone biosynthesis protein
LSRQPPDRTVPDPGAEAVAPAAAPAVAPARPLPRTARVSVNGDQPLTREQVLRPMPRRPRYQVNNTQRRVPKMEKVTFKVNHLRTIARLFRWLGLAMHLLVMIRWDRMRGRTDLRYTAVRVRRTLETAGGTFVKIGQQLGSRVDLLPYEICHELSEMFDAMASFPLEDAVAAVERAAGRPLHEVYAQFDPEPIGSASIACVYQARLLNGDKVAVKVRRPGIGERFAEDLLALDWLGAAAETLTLLRPQFTSMVRRDLREMLMEELDFVAEARYQEHFRRQLKRDRIDFVTAPRSYTELSNHEVHVEEFVAGIFLRELLDAHETNDVEYLARLKEDGITPARVGRRMLYVSYWSALEGILFHADPHPANVVVQKGSRLVFIDFGACGSTSDRTRRIRWELLTHLVRNDVSAAARSAVAMLEPLSHVDPDALVKRAELVWWKFLYAMRSKGAEWWERTSAGLWLSLFESTREFGLQINLDTLRMLRASLLYDTLAARLWPKLDDSAFLKYRKDMFRRRAKRAAKRSLAETPRERWMRQVTLMEDMTRTAERMISKAHDFTEQSPRRFLKLASKASFAASNLLVLGAQIALPALVLAASATAFNVYHGLPGPPFLTRVWSTVLHPAYMVYGLAMATLTFRRLQFRFADRD